MTITSSEKHEGSGRYEMEGMEVKSVPYPGVEFFRNYAATASSAETKFFDWNQAFANASISLGAQSCAL